MSDTECRGGECQQKYICLGVKVIFEQTITACHRKNHPESHNSVLGVLVAQVRGSTL